MVLLPGARNIFAAGVAKNTSVRFLFLEVAVSVVLRFARPVLRMIRPLVVKFIKTNYKGWEKQDERPLVYQ